MNHKKIRIRLTDAENTLAHAELKMREMAPRVIANLIERGLTLRQVARRIKRSPTYVSHVRNGHTQCSAKTYFALSWLLQKMEENGE